MTSQPEDDPIAALDTAALLLRRLSGAAAGAALELLGRSVPDRDPPGATPREGTVYALVDVGVAGAEPVAAAFATLPIDGVSHLSLSVAAAHRWRGLGDRLLGQILDVLRSQGVTRVDTEVGQGYDAALLYERSGFRLDSVDGRLVLDL